MLQILTRLASQLDSVGRSNAADKLDELITKIAATPFVSHIPLLSSELQDGPFEQPDEPSNVDMPGTQEMRSLERRQHTGNPGDARHEESAMSRHQHEQDKQHLVEDLAGQIEQGLGDRVVGKLNLAHKLVRPQVRLDLANGGSIIVILEENELSFWITCLIQRAGRQLDKLDFPINSQRGPIGPMWVNTVAQTIVGKLLDTSRQIS